ncbi:DNA polymerase beta superfamily protein [Streptantibioticus rubrisoli]|uniref:Nucleotidyltransferase domain-containing protein n=1 Tax=Streptantibioticus rubrisoli TaxID=1387313 RepID=A0ABT1P612_9ACTN|nr:nucleotidyltransferase domain-containing protein [Streptantibioticus rubrisoli]MCQ4040799.1 nucleotidyltransferase domain-containing protein [Streptantibioticus rubrisoli]
MHVLLSGTVGSTAYGLAHEGSDIDRLGVFAAPTVAFHGLRRPAESHVTTRPDRTLHEAAKYCRLALSGNPTVTELIWLPDELYEVRTALGDELIGIRRAFLSAGAVRDSYLGYAAQQFRKLRARAGAQGRKRSEKHARHLVRLLEQGAELHRTGHLTIRLADPDRVRALGVRIAAEPDHALPLLSRAEDRFARPGALPEAPDEAAAEAWLRTVRAALYARN